ncbi:DinB family protein [Streptomyces sp. NPDC003077]|uniref:DinB family protein n=1 Tax=Streptomyces sp. NPDC003077 TaxID=3154443 RepID=UPI00339E1371
MPDVTPGRPTDTTSRGDLRPPSINADEKTTLSAFLDYLREAVIAKAAGVPDQDARTPGVPSGTSLFGLLKHLTAVEHNWFTWAYAGAEVDLLDDDALPTTEETYDTLVTTYRQAIAASNALTAACEDLDVPGARSLRETPPPSMRWLLVHMIEETSRHAGHADILREQFDGAVGR